MLLLRRTKQLLLALIFIFLLVQDFSYSFKQYYHAPLDGDITSGVIVSSHLQETLGDPFGLKTMWNNKRTPNPNRYFSHQFFVDYFTHVPLWFQKTTSPINSIYAACASIKLLTHILLVYLLAAFITGSGSLFKVEVLGSMVLMTVFFQAHGYYHYMGIIDHATTYNFFYAIPLLLLLFFFYQFYSSVRFTKDIRFSPVKHIIVVILLLILPFSGPLIPGIFLVTSCLILVYYYRVSRKVDHQFSIIETVQVMWFRIPTSIRVYFTLGSLLSLYSLVLGTHNSVYSQLDVSLLDRYLNLPLGIYNQFTQKLGFPLLLAFIGVNTLLIRKYYYNAKGKQIITDLKWLGLFALIYILLLPLGGYRPYRPNTLRYDTIMPITVGLLFILGTSTYFLLHQIKTRKFLYLAPLFALLIVFNRADRNALNENACERLSLALISDTSSDTISIAPTCPVLSWQIHPTPKQLAQNAKLLQLWNVLPRNRQYRVLP